MKFVFGENVRNVDSAIPHQLAEEIRDPENPSNTSWYVMDYNENRAFGKLVNLKEKFFDKLVKDAIHRYNHEITR
jgi:hypothetical protein